MAFFARKLGIQEDPDKIVGQLYPDYARSHNQDIHIVVLDALMGRVAVVADSSRIPGSLLTATDANREIAASLGYAGTDIDAMVRDGVLYAEEAVSRLVA